MNITILSSKKMPFWEFFLALFLCTVYLLPSSSLGSTIVLGLLLTYLAYLALVDQSMVTTVLKVLGLVVLLAFIYAMLTDANSISQTVSNRTLKRFISKLYQYTTLYFPAILFLAVQKRASEKQKKVLLFTSLVLVVYVVVSTWSFLQENPNATREWESVEDDSNKDVANYYFIYAIPMLISVLTIAFVRFRGIGKWISLAAITVGILFLVAAQYTLSILITLIGILIQVYRNLSSQRNKTLFVFGMVLLAVFLPSILKFAITHINSEQVIIRLGEIHDFLTGKGAGGYNLSGRLTLYWKSIVAFFHSPVWGNRSLDFDGHATFLTVLSNIGLLGGIPFYLLFALVCKKLTNCMGESAKQFRVIIIMFVMMGLTNPVHASMPLGFATWFLAPLIIQMIFKEEEVHETAVED